MTTDTYPISPAHALLRRARRLGVRFRLDTSQDPAIPVIDKGTKHLVTPALKAELHDERDGIWLRLLWEHGQKKMGARPCPTCLGIDYGPNGRQIETEHGPVEVWDCQGCASTAGAMRDLPPVTDPLALEALDVAMGVRHAEETERV